MKKSIGKRVLAIIIGPVLVILGLLCWYISYTVMQNLVDWTELELKGITEINAAQLEGRINSVRITVQSAAAILNEIDSQSPQAREQADECIRIMFNNESIYNSWLVYEPDAFDGRDADYTGDYPGAPSGRFMRSYVAEGGQIIVAPDMDEETIDDPMESPWYTVPKEENRLYVDVTNSVNDNLYDYGVGGDPVYTLSIVSPLTRNGQVIGCVGADVAFDTMTFGIGNAKKAAVAVFYPDGRVFFAEDIRYAEDSIDSLEFLDHARIKQALVNGESLFMPKDFCPFLSESAFIYFNPVNSEGMNDNNLYLYVALPRAAVLSGMIPVLAPVAILIALFLAALCGLYIFTQQRVFRSIRKLTLSADAISQGDLQAGVTSFSKSEDEIGTLSRSLNRMVEQFRVYIFRQDRIQEESTFHSYMFVAADAGDEPSAYAALTEMLRKHFRLYRATLVLHNSGRAYVAAFSKARERTIAMEPADFFHHFQVVNLLAPDRKLVFLNKHAISSHKLPFIGSDTVSMCIVPIANEQGLLGYLILENNDLRTTFKAGTEQAILYIAKMLPEWFSDIQNKGGCKRYGTGRWVGDPESALEGAAGAEETGFTETVTPPSGSEVTPEAIPEPKPEILPEPKPEPKPEILPEAKPKISFLDALRGVNGLYADKAIEIMGGMSDLYERTVLLIMRTAPENIEKMDKYIQTENMPSFAIEIHGMKGALNNIGASELGDLAARLERTAKEDGEPSRCTEQYGIFRERLTALMKEILRLSQGDEPAETNPPGERSELVEALKAAGDATRRYDCQEALDSLTPLLDKDYGEESNERLRELCRLLEQYEYEKAAEIITAMGGPADDAETE